MQVHGQLHHIGSTQQITDNFSKRDFIVITDHTSQYPQFIKFQVANQKTSLLDKFREGEIVSVDFNLQGRLNPKNDKEAFNTLQAWKIEKV